MIAALFLRHYKVYQGATFIPVIEDLYPQTLFIGDNAVGKSSILEALNVYFNDEKWNLTRGAKREEAFIAPVFLIKKEKVTPDLVKEIHRKSNSKEALKRFSDNVYASLINGDRWYRSVSSDSMKRYYTTKTYRQLFDYIEKISKSERFDDYYIFMSAKAIQGNEIPQVLGETSRESKITENLSEEDITYLHLFTKGYYTYVYFPVESNANEVLKLDSSNLQKLMNKNVLSSIETMLKESTYKVDKTSDSKAQTLTKHLNDTMDSFMSDINDILKELNGEYEFTHKGNSFKNITEKHLIDIIVQRFLSVRSLKNNKKDIGDLSSGEQRQSIINISLAFLKNSNNSKLGEVITAIDEPEVSLHMSKMYNQFELVSQISMFSQLLITTHWYGYLPVLTKGSIQYIENNEDGIKIHSSVSNEFYSKRNSEIKDDIYLKSYFDLSISIFSSIREGSNWIICEGLTDKKYIEAYFRVTEGAKDLKVLAVGGLGEVIRLYNHLFFPVNDHQYTSEHGKVLFLTDTDSNMPKLGNLDSVKQNQKIEGQKISINRLCGKSENRLTNYNNNSRNNTEIENCLDSELFAKSIIQALTASDKPVYNELSEKLLYNHESDPDNSYSLDPSKYIFDYRKLEPADFSTLADLFKDNDMKISVMNYYIESINPNLEIPIVFRTLFKKLSIYDEAYIQKTKTINILASGDITITNQINNISNFETVTHEFKKKIREIILLAEKREIKIPTTLKLPRARTRNIYSENGRHINNKTYNKSFELSYFGNPIYFSLDWSDDELIRVVNFLSEKLEEWQ